MLPDFDTVSQTVSLVESGALVAATDGSFNPHRRKATGSWILSTKNGKRQVQGVCPVDGDLASMDSYRAELEAIRSLVYYLRLLRLTAKLTVSPLVVPLWVDNDQALKRTTDFSEDPRQALEPEYDIIQDIHVICSTHKIRFAGRHIKSHQDHKGVLPIEILLNERCDEIAKRCVRIVKLSRRLYYLVENKVDYLLGTL